MKIGILQTGHVPDEMRAAQGDFAAMFQRLLAGRGFDFETWNVVDMEFPGGPDAADGWLITGSKHGAYEDHPWIPPLEALIRAAYAAEVPVVGVCFGHQIVAQALGGKVEKFEGGWSVGRQVYDWNGRQVALNAWHQDQVTEAPEEAETVATHPNCAHAALVYGDRAFTVQPHPEFDEVSVANLIEHRGMTVPGPLLDAAREGLAAPVEQERLAAQMARFFTERRIA